MVLSWLLRSAALGQVQQVLPPSLGGVDVSVHPRKLRHLRPLPPGRLQRAAGTHSSTDYRVVMASSLASSSLSFIQSLNVDHEA